jgi:hypothetical protein
MARKSEAAAAATLESSSMLSPNEPSSDDLMSAICRSMACNSSNLTRVRLGEGRGGGGEGGGGGGSAGRVHCRRSASRCSARPLFRLLVGFLELGGVVYHFFDLGVGEADE